MVISIVTFEHYPAFRPDYFNITVYSTYPHLTICDAC